MRQRYTQDRAGEESSGYRSILKTGITKREQLEYVRPMLACLRDRFEQVYGRRYINAVSLRTGHTYNRVQSLLSGTAGSPTFFDVTLLAQAGGISLDYLASKTDLDYQPEDIEYPTRADVLSDEEQQLIEQLRALPSNQRESATSAIQFALRNIAEGRRPSATRPPSGTSTRRKAKETDEAREEHRARP